MCILLSIIGHTINKAHHLRYDGNPRLDYYYPEDLGLCHDDFSFKSGRFLLRGSRYWVEAKKAEALVVFFHGIGAGRNAYMKEIAALAKEGYLVYAYDNTGCMDSEGTYIKGIGQTAKDQAAFFAWLEKDPRSKGLRRYAVGHSWGGYSALLSAKKEFKVEKIVSLAGFSQPSRQYASYLRPHWLRALRPEISLFLFLQLGPYGDIDAVKRIKRSNVKLLYIQGNEDQMVPMDAGMNDLRKRLGKRPNTEFVIVNHQGHNPYLSVKSEKYLMELNKMRAHSLDGPSTIDFDLVKATEENEAVMKKVFDFLAG